MAGSKRSSSRNWIARHSARSRAPMPVGSNVWTTRDDLFDPLRRGAQPIGDLFGALAQIAGLVDGVDDGVADHAIDRIAGRHRQLRGEMVGKRRLLGDIGFDIGRFARSFAAARSAGPGGVGKPKRFQLVLLGRRSSGRDRRRRRFQSRCRGFRPALPARRPVAAAFQSPSAGSPKDSAEIALDGVAPGASIPVGVGIRPVFRALQQRIALKLVLDKGGQLDARKLQQLDRLQELRRHDQGLALPKQHFCGQSHIATRSNEPGAGSTVYRPISCIHDLKGRGHEKHSPERPSPQEFSSMF